MPQMKKIFINWIKKLFSDSHSAIIGIALGSIFAGGTGIYFFAKKLWAAIIDIAQTPTPLWATTALALLSGVYIYLKTSIHRSSSLPQKRNYVIKHFAIGPYKWETKIYDYGYFEVDKYPLCTTHDLKFIFSSDGKYCPGTEKEKCNNRLNKNDEFKVYESAKSIIENKVRNKTY